MIAWWLKFRMTETIHKAFQWWTAWNKAAFSLRRSSVQYSPPCWRMPSMTARLDYRSDTGLMAGCSTLGAWRLFQRWRRLSSETSCLLMTVPSTPAQSRWCSTKCTVYSRCDNFGLTISTKKTEVMYQPAPGKPYQESHITVKGQNLQAVDNFTYLGSTSYRVLYIDAEVNNRMAKASRAFESLCKNVWEWRDISLTT